LKGTVKNFKTGESISFESNAYKSISKAHYAELKALSTAKNIHRKIEKEKAYEEVSKQVSIKFKYFKDASSNNPYLEKKGVVSFGLKEDGRQNLIMPLRDEDGKMWGWQAINTNSKMISKGGKKEGCFHLMGAASIVDLNDTVIIAEGYATAASIHMSTGKATIAAVDAGNLKTVAKKVREVNADVAILIAGDNDILNEKHAKTEALKKKANVGKIKAEDAALEVGGHALIAPLAQREIEKGYSDFNDLAKIKGLDFVKSVISEGIMDAKEKLLQHERSSAAKKKFPVLDVDIKELDSIEEFISKSITEELKIDSVFSDVTKERILAYASLMGDKPLVDAVTVANKEDMIGLGEYFSELGEDEYLSYSSFRDHVVSQTVA